MSPAAPPRYVALLRGINVGRAKRVAMSDLRSLIESLGYREVETLLNSGNAVFAGGAARTGDPAPRIEAAMKARLGVPARVLVLTSAELGAILRANPLRGHEVEPSRLFVGFLMNPADRARLAPLAKQSWGRDTLAVGTRAAYYACPLGLSRSELPKALERALGDGMTTRNWATATKLLERASTKA